MCLVLMWIFFPRILRHIYGNKIQYFDSLSIKKIPENTNMWVYTKYYNFCNENSFSTFHFLTKFLCTLTAYGTLFTWNRDPVSAVASGGIKGEGCSILAFTPIILPACHSHCPKQSHFLSSGTIISLNFSESEFSVMYFCLKALQLPGLEYLHR